MADLEGLARVLTNTNKIFERKRLALYALSLKYAALALNDFRKEQTQDAYWVNQTYTALNEAFSNAFIEEYAVGWYLAHGVEYGVYLELANDGDHAGIQFTVEQFTEQFFADAQKLYKD